MAEAGLECWHASECWHVLTTLCACLPALLRPQAAADYFGVRIAVLSSFPDSCFLELEPRQASSSRVLWLSFWAEVHPGTGAAPCLSCFVVPEVAYAAVSCTIRELGINSPRQPRPRGPCLLACLHVCRCTTILSIPQTTHRPRCQTTNCWAAAACTACCLEGHPAPPSHPPDRPALLPVPCLWISICCLLCRLVLLLLLGLQLQKMLHIREIALL